MAGGIRNPTNMFSAINNDTHENMEKDSFCQSCLNVGIRSILKKRMYRFNDKTKEPELIRDADKDKFRQCYNCGDIVPIYEVKKEAKISDFVETVDNPFDAFNSEGMGVLNETAGQAIANKRNPSKRKYKQRQELIDREKDEDVRELLEKGADLTYYNET